MTDDIELSVDEGSGIATLTFELPVFRIALGIELDRMVDHLEGRPEVGAVILTGRKNVFLTGADLKEFLALGGVPQVVEYMNVAKRMLGKIYNSSKIYVAAINGYCLGGGLELALACDLRVAVAEVQNLGGQSVPFLGFPEVNLGIIPPLGGAYLLEEAVGPARAKELLFSGGAVGGQYAFQLGLVNVLTGPDELMGEARARAWGAANNRQFALRELKRLLHPGRRRQSFEQAQDEAIEAFARCWENGEKNGLLEGLRNRGRLRKPAATG